MFSEYLSSTLTCLLEISEAIVDTQPDNSQGSSTVDTSILKGFCYFQAPCSEILSTSLWKIYKASLHADTTQLDLMQLDLY